MLVPKKPPISPSTAGPAPTSPKWTTSTLTTSSWMRRFTSLPQCAGSYVGDGKITRAVDLGFRPKICLVYTDFVPLLRMNPTLYTEVQIGFAILSEAGCSMGASLTDTGISVRSGAGEYDYEAFFLNSSGQTYYYIAFR